MLRFTNVDHKPTRLPPIYGFRTHPLLPLRQALEPILPRINELEEFIKIAKTECHFPSEHGLTREESASIYLYTMDWGEQSLYRLLNEQLRVKDRTVLVPWHGYLKLFDTALKKLPSLQMSLWRGVNLDISKNFKEGEELTWWSFNSCSSSVKVVKQFLGSISTLIMIEAKKGKLISAYSNFPQENEVILGLGTRLCVASDALEHSSLNVVHLRELSDENDEGLSSSLASMSVSSSMKGGNEPSLNNKSSTSKVKIYDNGKYEGELKNDKKHGKGTYYWTSGENYTGNWVDDKMAGHGVYTLHNGDRYEGQYKDDKKNGKGTYYFANGNKYTGDWVDENRTGQAVMIWSNGNIDDAINEQQMGQFKDANLNGKGTLYWPNGNKYTGDWVNGKRTGQGVFTWANGDRYEGEYKDDKKDGKGTLYHANGKVQQGMWSDDQFIG